MVPVPAARTQSAPVLHGTFLPRRDGVPGSAFFFWAEQEALRRRAAGGRGRSTPAFPRPTPSLSRRATSAHGSPRPPQRPQWSPWTSLPGNPDRYPLPAWLSRAFAHRRGLRAFAPGPLRGSYSISPKPSRASWNCRGLPAARAQTSGTGGTRHSSSSSSWQDTTSSPGSPRPRTRTASRSGGGRLSGNRACGRSSPALPGQCPPSPGWPGRQRRKPCSGHSSTRAWPRWQPVSPRPSPGSGRPAPCSSGTRKGSASREALRTDSWSSQGHGQGTWRRTGSPGSGLRSGWRSRMGTALASLLPPPVRGGREPGRACVPGLEEPPRPHTVPEDRPPPGRGTLPPRPWEGREGCPSRGAGPGGHASRRGHAQSRRGLPVPCRAGPGPVRERVCGLCPVVVEGAGPGPLSPAAHRQKRRPRTLIRPPGHGLARRLRLADRHRWRGRRGRGVPRPLPPQGAAHPVPRQVGDARPRCPCQGRKVPCPVPFREDDASRGDAGGNGTGGHRRPAPGRRRDRSPGVRAVPLPALRGPSPRRSLRRQGFTGRSVRTRSAATAGSGSCGTWASGPASPTTWASARPSRSSPSSTTSGRAGAGQALSSAPPRSSGTGRARPRGSPPASRSWSTTAVPGWQGRSSAGKQAATTWS